jgi:hypothetical protein
VQPAARLRHHGRRLRPGQRQGVDKHNDTHEDDAEAETIHLTQQPNPRARSGLASALAGFVSVSVSRACCLPAASRQPDRYRYWQGLYGNQVQVNDTTPSTVGYSSRVWVKG